MNNLDFGWLSSFSLMEISGPDAERFLQGQLTCNVTTLNDQHWTLGACCNAKGRMVANFVIANINGSYWLRLPSDNAENLKTHLSRYIVFFKAHMQVHQDWQVLGSLSHYQQPQLVSETLPLQAATDHFLLTWPDGRQERWQSSNANTSNPANNEQWQQADITQGLAWVSLSTQLEWLPQEIDWGIQGGVNFNKGCYTGQEIVARLQFLGKSKKRWALINSQQPLELAPLQPLTTENGKNAGYVAHWFRQQGLAILNQHDEATDGLLANEQPLTSQDLFYQTAEL